MGICCTTQTGALWQHRVFPGDSEVNDGPAMQKILETQVDPWVGKIPWRRVWQPTPVLLPGKIPSTEEPGGLQSMGSQRVGRDWSGWARRHAHVAYRVLVPWPGIRPVPPEVQARSLNRWTTREVLCWTLLNPVTTIGQIFVLYIFFSVFIWFWYQADAQLVGWKWKHSFIFNFLKLLEEYRR